MTTRQLLLGIELLVLLACLTLALSVVVSKVTRLRRESRTALALAPVRGALIELAAGEPDGLPALRSARGKTADAIDHAAVGLLAKVRGEPASQLVTVLEEHGAIDRARADIAHRSPVHRARAVQLLGLARVDDCSALISEALEDEASDVRASAAYAAAYLADPWLAAPLLRSVGAGGGIPAGLAADALLEMGFEITPVLRAAMRNPAPRTRMVAAHVAGVGTFVPALPELRELVDSDPDLTVRVEAAEALGLIGRDSEIDLLARHTAQGAPTDLRRACARALGRIGSADALGPLVALLLDPDTRLAELAAHSLVQIGPLGMRTLQDRRSEPAAGTALVLAGLRAGTS
ncbi:HEAT repeat domain-containing protein [Pedococcus sp. KACC 23699]|uniref:HEAT repeat domain-containing protein n=1 Tax=Pedococcus sp. KACC 23699 TaxID=3149228 RepID=A0AAU7JR12_9MICO